ncbi:Helicase conserved C-terminal domain-containing protein [Massilia sp. PDC64]|nr:Helicase conserved C-terminal domain-containing protein [Massilia sp. PDC64]
MQPSARARYAAAVTLSKSKMYEYGVPEESHIVLPDGLELEMQFPLAVGTLGDIASEIVAASIGSRNSNPTPRSEVVFSAQILQAFDDSLLNEELSVDLRLLSAAGFYLGDVPGNAAVQVSKVKELIGQRGDYLGEALAKALDKPWELPGSTRATHRATAVLAALGEHFRTGGSVDLAVDAIRSLRNWAYRSASPHDLLMADLLGAVSATRIANSAWTLLPQYSGLPSEYWDAYLSRTSSIKEMWPSQRLLGEAGLYRGLSGVVQMPTSSGKSRATELVIRSAFLSGRTRLALVVAPFRALCQEVANDLTNAFKEDGYEVNQPSDALQVDVAAYVFGVLPESPPRVVVLTPEKLLYMLRQDPDIVQEAGLVVYDEGHQFDTGIRGVTYELLLTSIKRLLPACAQIVLISAVIQNAVAISSWLLGGASQVVSDQSLQARRLVAFASFPTGSDGQLGFNLASPGEQEFFVPRVIVREKQPRLPRERTDRFFPTDETGSTALYLALRLVGNGGVAIYAGKKLSAAKIVRDAVEQVFGRGVSLDPPSVSSNPEELRRFQNLYRENFGEESYLTKAAALGIFAHHGNTPQGIRISVEHAMRQRLIRLIVCTSTLAQGVNLPIRYLLVTSSMQGRESIKARDFHNLMGRAGRAGMYGEGTVIFTDHRLYDERRKNARRWSDSLQLVNPSGAGPTGSTLLSLFDPLRNETGTNTLATPSPVAIAARIVDDWEELYKAVGSLTSALRNNGFSTESLREQLRAKKSIVEAIESFLMTYRSDLSSAVFIAAARDLAGETLAHSLADPAQQEMLSEIFEAVGRRIERLVPEPEVQSRFGRTLLGIDKSLEIEAWVKSNLQSLEQINSDVVLFEALWPLLIALSSEKRLTDTEPGNAIRTLAGGWLDGNSFGQMLAEVDALGGTYPHGSQRRKFDIDQIVGLCEQAFGFEFSLLIAAVKESFASLTTEEAAAVFSKCADTLQKRLKYGLPNSECVAYFEAGYGDRVVAQSLAAAVWWESVTTSSDVRRLARQYPEDFEQVLRDFPSYFSK